MNKSRKHFGPEKRVGRVLNPIEPVIRGRVEGKGLYVLRRKGTDEPLNVSYSQQGLRWTTDRNRRLLYYRDAELRHRKIGDLYVPTFFKRSKDGLEKSNGVYVTEYIPLDHYKVDKEGKVTSELDPRLQVAEYMIASRALRMLYKVENSSDILVYSSDEESDDEEIGLND